MPLTDQQEIRSRNARLFNHHNFSGNRAFFTSFYKDFSSFSPLIFNYLSHLRCNRIPTRSKKIANAPLPATLQAVMIGSNKI